MKKKTLKVILGVCVFVSACGTIGVIGATLATIGTIFVVEWLYGAFGPSKED